MTKKSIKLLIAILAMMLTVSVFATGFSSALVEQSQSTDLGQFAGKGDSSNASESLQNLIGAAITIIQVVGSGVAIIMLIVLAIKYISAAPGDKAEIKKHAVVYVVGAIVLFAATGILGIVKSFASNISSNESTATE